VTNLAVFDISARFRHLKPTHIANCFLGTRQRIFYRFFESVWLGANQFNFFVSMIRHVSIISRLGIENNKKPILD